MLLVTATTCADEGERVCNLVFNWTENQAQADIAEIVVGKPLALLGLLLAFLVLRWVLHKLVGRVVTRAEMGFSGRPVADARRAQRVGTMGGLFKSVITGILAAVVGTMMLSQVGVNIAPIIASAGIIGIALGFGAQNLVKDFLSGTFMILEDQFGVGDIIDIGDATGTVEAVSLRVTRLRDIYGTVWYVPNGEIVRVGNQSQNWSRTVLDVGVSYGSDLAEVRRVLEEVAHEMWEDEGLQGKIIEEPAVWGVQDLAADAVTMRVVLKTTPGSQWAVAREMRQRIKGRFDTEGIEIPFPQRVVWTKSEQAAEESVTEGSGDLDNQAKGAEPEEADLDKSDASYTESRGEG